jgi:hypothetical protein
MRNSRTVFDNLFKPFFKIESGNFAIMSFHQVSNVTGCNTVVTVGVVERGCREA